MRPYYKRQFPDALARSRGFPYVCIFTQISKKNLSDLLHWLKWYAIIICA